MKFILPIILLLSFHLNAQENDFIIVEGDIAKKTSGLDKAAPNPRNETWPNGEVPWEINAEDLSNHYLIKGVKEALKIISRKTNVIFRPRIPRDRDYLSFTSQNKGCYSFVGKVGGKQLVNLGAGCYNKMIAAHEIFHALGMEHEQSREDRDRYIKIHWDNVESSNKHNFRIVPGARHGKYNLKSIMHYSSFTFSNNGNPTMTTLDGKTFRQNLSKLSQGDIDGINFIYPSQGNRLTPSDIQLVFSPQGEKLSFYLNVGQARLRSIASVQYYFENSQYDSEKKYNKQEYFEHHFYPKKGRNSILVSVMLRDGRILEKKVYYHHSNKVFKAICSMGVSRTTTNFEVPISYGSETLITEKRYRGHISRVNALYDEQRNGIILDMILIRKPRIIRKIEEKRKTVFFSSTDSVMIVLKFADLVCKVSVESQN